MPHAEIDWAELEERVERPDSWERLTLREKQVYLLRYSTDPPMTIADIAVLLDCSARTVSNALRALREAEAEPPTEGAIEERRRDISAGRVPQGQFLQLLERNSKLLLEAVPALIERADLKTVSASIRDHMNIRQLLLNEPTVIHGSSDREKMNDVLSMILAECRRRGIEFGTNPHTGSALVLEAESEREPASSTPPS